MAVSEVLKSGDVLLAAGPLVRLVDGDEAVAEVDEHPGGDDDGVHPRHPLHQHQGHPNTLEYVVELRKVFYYGILN